MNNESQNNVRRCQMYRILDKTVDQMTIYAPLVSKNCQPGHFIILRVDDKGERIPLTVVNHNECSIDVIYQKLGYSTRLLGTMNIGDSIHDLVGPLGEAIDMQKFDTILAIAGGVGAAPIYPQLFAYSQQGVSIDLVLGARSEEYLLLVPEFKKICRNVFICTDDGSKGTKGFVTDIVSELIKNSSYDHSIAIGPLVMMKHVVLLNKKHDLQTDVSLNPIMIDGTGMCGNCRVSIAGKTFFACVDGPDFPGEEVDFDELIARQSYYENDEHVCNLELKINDSK